MAGRTRRRWVLSRQVSDPPQLDLKDVQLLAVLEKGEYNS